MYRADALAGLVSNCQGNLVPPKRDRVAAGLIFPSTRFGIGRDAQLADKRVGLGLYPFSCLAPATQPRKHDARHGADEDARRSALRIIRRSGDRGLTIAKGSRGEVLVTTASKRPLTNGRTLQTRPPNVVSLGRMSQTRKQRSLPHGVANGSNRQQLSCGRLPSAQSLSIKATVSRRHWCSLAPHAVTCDRLCESR